MFSSFFSIGQKSYIRMTEEIPQEGGTYIEGILGQPKIINPLFSPSNPVDRIISSLIYSGLTKIDKNGNIAPDLAETWSMSEDQKKYTFKLRKNLKWHNGEPLLSNDIRYTIFVIQDPDYIGPLKNQWKNIQVETPDELTVTFQLENPSSIFLHNTTLGIIPEHIWAEHEISDLPFLEKNLSPVGSNSYKFSEIKTDKEGLIKNILLEKNNDYYSEKPKINNLLFKFYKNNENIFKALKEKEILATSDIPPENYNVVRDMERIKTFSYTLPNYKALFINSAKNPYLENISFKTALELSINKEKIVNEKLNGFAVITDGIYPKNNELIKNIEKSKEILKNLKLKDNNNDGYLDKNGQNITVKLSVLQDRESLTVAESIKEDFKQIGINLDIEQKNQMEIERDVIKPRNYEILFFGQNIGLDEDLYAFWHSSQTKDPGLNLTNISSKRIDILLENNKNLIDRNKKSEVNTKIEEAIKQEKAAIFLYSNIFKFTLDKKIKNVKKHYLAFPEHKYIGIENWYIKHKRVFKK